jgi:phage-related protein
VKRVHWLGDSRKAVGRFPAAVRQVAGYQLHRVQCGLDPHDWKPMRSIAAGVREIRVHLGGEWRVIYLATRPEAVYVLHAFGKKTGKTPPADIALARERFRQIEAGRR